MRSTLTSNRPGRRFVRIGRPIPARLLLLAVFVLPGLNPELVAQRTEDRVMTGIRFDGNTSVISMVVAGGPADQAGVKVGDELISVGKQFVVQSIDLVTALEGKQAGDVIPLEIRRAGQYLLIDVTLMQAVEGDVVVNQDGSVEAAPLKLGIKDELGPELTCRDWWGIDQGVSGNLKDNRGKVVCMLFFQADCRYSNRYGLPELKKLQEQFTDDPNVLVMAVQTPFQNFEINTLEAGTKLFKENGLKGPLGHDSQAGRKSKTFQNYKALGTPWFVVLDKQGIVRYNDSSLPVEEAIEMVGEIKAEKQPTESRPDSQPKKGEGSMEKQTPGRTPTPTDPSDR